MNHLTTPGQGCAILDNNSPDYFGRVPNRAFTLCQHKTLIVRDIQVLALVMTYAASGNAVVTTFQRTLARRLNCSLKTIQRSLQRLEKAGFLVGCYIRDGRGRLKGKDYDVSNTVAMCRTKATSESAGSDGTEPGNPSIPARRPKRHRSPSKTESPPAVVERDNNAAALTAPEAAVASSLRSLGVYSGMALRLLRRHGLERTQEAVQAAQEAKGVRDRAGWVVAYLEKGWQRRTAEPEARPQVQQQFRADYWQDDKPKEDRARHRGARALLPAAIRERLEAKRR